MSAVPFGMTANGMNAWFYYGNGLKLWRELYAPYNIIPFPAGNTGVQMGGWFNRKIESVQDLKGLKMRIGGLGASVVARLGVIPQILSAGEINAALRLGKIDAAEWIGPAHDRAMQLYRSARYYYYPGWHEPGSTTELMINRQAWEGLPPDLQRIIEIGAQALNQMIYSQFEASNIRALRDLQQHHEVEVLPFPKDVIRALKRETQIVLEEESQKDPMFRRMYEDYQQFRKDINEWDFTYGHLD
jgi:TRAP-type mannitol/chloroaromatic compound transport system substrate-binding protein